MPQGRGETLMHYHERLWRARPITDETIRELRNLCDNEDCGQIECLAVKAALAAYDQVTSAP